MTEQQTVSLLDILPLSFMNVITYSIASSITRNTILQFTKMNSWRPHDFDPKISTSSFIVPDLTLKPLYDMIVVQNPLKIVNFVIKQTEEKPTYRDAITGYNKDKWIAEIYEELKSIQQNQTW